MTDEKKWDELSDYYAGHTPEIIREIQVPDRALTADDLDDIFAGRPLADQPRPKADIPCEDLSDQGNPRPRPAVS